VVAPTGTAAGRGLTVYDLSVGMVTIGPGDRHRL